MTKIEKQEILVPLLEKYYPNEESFNDNFKDLIKTGGDLYLSRPFGISINVTNIITTEEANRVMHVLENNNHFKQTLKDGFDQMDGGMFEKESEFSFKRWIFKSEREMKIGIKDGDGKELNFFLFISMACTNLDHHIVSFNFTTWDESKIKEGKAEDAWGIENAYVRLSNKQIIDLVSKDEELYLFSIDAGLERDLNKGNIPKGLRKVFKNEGFKLSKNTTVTTEKDDKWRINDKKNVYIVQKEKEKLNIYKKFKKLERALNQLGEGIEDLLNINKNTFLSIQFWRKDWKSEEDNLLDAKDYIKHPYYFYSIITLDKNVFRRNYKNIMDVLGWCFSTSRVYLGMFSQNAFLELTIKPGKDRFIAIGHDASEFKAWEILGLQKYLLDQINITHSEYTKKHQKIMASKVDKLIEELNKVYDFNAFIQKKRKGETWIKFNRYLQDIIGISSDHELYENRHERKKEGEDRKSAVRLARLNAVLSSLIFATIFVSILTFLLHPETRLTVILGNFTISEILNVGKYSLCATIILSIILSISFISVFKLIEVIIYKYKK